MNKISIFILGAIFASCVSGGGESNGEVKVLKPLTAQESSAESVKEIVAEMKKIELEMVERSPIMGIRKVVIAPNGDLLIMDSKRVHQHTADGKAVRTMGEVGRARNEYTSLDDICVDYANNRLLMLDGMSRVLFFDLKDGSHIKSLEIKVDDQVISADGIVAGSKGGFFIASCYMQNRDFTKPTPALYEFDYDGVLKSSQIEVEETMVTRWLSTQNPDNTYLLRPFDNYNNIVYRVRRGAVAPAYHVDFEGQEAKKGAIYGSSGTMDIGLLFRDNSYKYVTKVQETDDYISFLVAGPEFSAYSYIFNKESDKAYRINTPDARAMPIMPLVSDSEYMYYPYQIYSEKELEKSGDPLRRLFVERFGYSDERSNPAIVAVKFAF